MSCEFAPMSTEQPFYMESTVFCVGPAVAPKKEKRSSIKTIQTHEHADIEKALDRLHLTRAEILATKRLYWLCVAAIKSIGEDSYYIAASKINNSQISTSNKFELLSSLDLSCDTVIKSAIASLPNNEPNEASLQAKFDTIEKSLRLQLQNIKETLERGLQQAGKFALVPQQFAKSAVEEKKADDTAMKDG
jgi:hypothetical protein